MMTLADKGRNLFDLVSVLPADKLDANESVRLSCWIDSGRAGTLDYMKRPLDRCDPATVMPEVKTVVVVARFYEKSQKIPGVARFAQGEDYHFGIKNDLYRLLSEICQEFPGTKGRAIVDTAPAFEKAWARRAGFGWVGRNTLIVNPVKGSFFNIGLLLLDRSFPEERSPEIYDQCGECRACIDACPMNAICDDRMIDTRKCISALTVERKRRGETVKPLHGWEYGCDECQICCPFNQL